MENFITSKKSQWAFIFGLLLIVAGFSANKVISCPHECTPDKAIDVSQLTRIVS